MSMTSLTHPDELAAGTSADQLAHISRALKQLRFGVIQLTVHDGKLMQMDVTERRRFT